MSKNKIKFEFHPKNDFISTTMRKYRQESLPVFKTEEENPKTFHSFCIASSA
jgi:hypothetical protein